MHDGTEHGCGRYFCIKHLLYARVWSEAEKEEVFPQLCQECYDQVEDLDDLEDPGD
jgi:hypothetical protein